VIGEQVVNGQINEQQAGLLLAMQTGASRNVLLTLQGLALLAVEEAINAALNVVKSAAIFRATASVARLAFPFCFSVSYTRARSWSCLGASFAASTSTRWMCLLRCLESGVRVTLSAELFSSPQSPQ
jgi:hypothetical protein